MLSDYIKKFQKQIKEDTYDIAKENEIFHKIHDANEVILEISQNELHKNVLKYISPYFGFDLK
jgi:hypothetical protein